MTTHNLIILFIAAGALILAIMAIEMLVRRNRMLWREIWSLQKQVATDRAFVSEQLRSLYQFGDAALRLPRRLPSQQCEELYVLGYFKGRRDGCFVEIGANDGLSLSNTYLLESLGWNGLLVEANPTLAQQCGDNRPHSQVIHAAMVADSGVDNVTFYKVSGKHGLDTLSFTIPHPQHLQRLENSGATVESITVPAATVDAVLGRHGIDRPDFVSIDVEGAELDVLKGFDLRRYRPRLLVLEDNGYGVDADVAALLAAQGYVEIIRFGHNVFYAPEKEQ